MEKVGLEELEEADSIMQMFWWGVGFPGTRGTKGEGAEKAIKGHSQAYDRL